MVNGLVHGAGPDNRCLHHTFYMERPCRRGLRSNPLGDGAAVVANQDIARLHCSDNLLDLAGPQIIAVPGRRSIVGQGNWGG